MFFTSWLVSEGNVVILVEILVEMLLIVEYSISLFWHEHAAFQRSAFGWSTAGNEVVALIFIILSSFFPVISPVFLRRDLFS